VPHTSVRVILIGQGVTHSGPQGIEHVEQHSRLVQGSRTDPQQRIAPDLAELTRGLPFVDGHGNACARQLIGENIRDAEISVRAALMAQHQQHRSSVQQRVRECCESQPWQLLR
jgi:hypothetical protein